MVAKGSFSSTTMASGDKYARLTVISLAPNNRALCRCDCGNETLVRRDCLKSGNTKSCGCLRDEGPSEPLHKTHGMRWSSEYGIWTKMRQRCQNPNDPGYPEYGGRGIEVCDRWNGSFENFHEDMGDRPTPAHSIDRKDNDGNYEPDNCRWATKKEQANNRRPRRAKGYTLTADGYNTKLQRNGQRHYLGTFKTEGEAANAIVEFKKKIGEIK